MVNGKRQAVDSMNEWQTVDGMEEYTRTAYAGLWGFCSHHVSVRQVSKDGKVEVSPDKDKDKNWAPFHAASPNKRGGEEQPGQAEDDDNLVCA